MSTPNAKEVGVHEEQIMTLDKVFTDSPANRLSRNVFSKFDTHPPRAPEKKNQRGVLKGNP